MRALAQPSAQVQPGFFPAKQGFRRDPIGSPLRRAPDLAASPRSEEAQVPVEETAQETSVSLEDELESFATVTRSPRRELRCTECGYGAVAVGPLRCPMCGGDAWDFADWRPFQR